MRPSWESDSDHSHSSMDRLHSILGAIRLKAPVNDQEAESIHLASLDCPSCNTRNALGRGAWCQNCGYSIQLGRTMSAEEISAAQAMQSGEFNFESSQGLNFQQMMCLAGCVTAVVIFSLMARDAISDPDDRAYFGRIQLVVGVIGVLLAQMRAYQLACRASVFSPTSVNDTSSILHPIKLWSTVFRSLPNGRHVVYQAGSALMAIVMACSVIGVNLDGLYANVTTSLTEFDNASLYHYVKPEIGSGLAAGSDEALELSKRLLESKSMFTPREITELQKLAEINAPVLSGEFYVLGYLTNAAGEPRSILMLEVVGSKARYVGRVNYLEQNEEVQKQLETALRENRSRRPLIKNPYQARWVRPGVICQVQFSGFSPEKTLESPLIVSITTPPPRETVTVQKVPDDSL